MHRLCRIMYLMNEITTLLTHAGFAPLQDTGWLRVTGSDRVRWLNGMVTNSIQELHPGEGNYSFLLNAQGRIQGDLTAFLLDDAILLETGQPGVTATLLDHYIIMDDVELTVMTDLAGILIAGPQALPIVQALGSADNSAVPCAVTSEPQEGRTPNGPNLKQTAYASAPVYLVQAYSPLVPRFEIWSDPSTIAKIVNELRHTQVPSVSESTLTQLRLLEGTPLYGTDIRNTDAAKDLPQETNQTRALHFNKGCYLGQEIVERIRSRGQVHKTFSGFLLTGDLPLAGAALQFEGKSVGEITSVAAIDHPVAGSVQLALGYIRRELLERNAPLAYAGGGASPVPLPFSPPARR